MREKVEEILRDINPDILDYDGMDLVGDHLLNSFDIVSIVVQVSDEFHIDIDPALVVWDRFKTVESIMELLNEVTKR